MPNSVTVSTSYTRRKQVKEYEPEELTITVTEVFDDEFTAEAIAEIAQAQSMVVKSEVWRELQLSFDIDKQTGRLIETFPGALVVESHPAARGASRLRSVAPAEPQDEPEEEAPPIPKARAAKANRSAPSPRRRVVEEPEEDEPEQDEPFRILRADDPDGHWADLLKKPGDWFDNRESKQNSKAPDFRHKRKMDGDYKLGLWLANAPKGFEEEYDRLHG